MEKSLKKYCITAIILLAGIILLVLLTPLKRLVMPLLLGGVIAYFLRAPVRWLSRRMNKTWAVVLVFLVLAALVGLGIFFLIPVLAREVAEFAGKIPEYARQGYELLNRLLTALGIEELDLTDEGIYDQVRVFSARMGSMATKAIGNVSQITQTLFMYIYAPVFAFFLLKDGERISESAVYLLPLQWRKPVVKTVKQIDTQVWQYVSGLLLTAGAVALLSTLGFWVTGIKYAPVLGLVMGILDLIPYIGPLISIVPIVTVASIQGINKLLWALGVLLMVQQAENFLLNPMIVGGNLKLHPGLIMITVLAGNLLFGITGMIFAVPVVLMARVVCQNIYLSAIKS